MPGTGRPGWPVRVLALAAIGAALLASLALHLRGVERNLPDALDVDEDVLFRPAMRIAATGELNPGWFGYPGSTVIYPLAVLLHAQQAAFHGGHWTAPDGKLRFALITGDFAHSVRTGRWLSVAYGVASVALAAALAWSCFGAGTAVVAAFLAALSPVAIAFAQTLRSDSAATFFGLLFLLLVRRVGEAPSVRRQALAGLALGLAIASRYMMASAGLVLAAQQLLLLRRSARPRRDLVRGSLVAWGAVVVAFLAATPYMLLDARVALHGLATAARKQAVHVGVDQLGFAGNLGFYLAEAIPQAIGWPQYALALLGVATLLQAGNRAHLVLALYVTSFLAGISALGIHWQRWAIPVLPVLSILAARVIVGVAARMACSRGRSWRGAAMLGVVAATITAAWQPAGQAVRESRLNGRPSTEVAALDWVLANLPDGSRIAYEWYSAPLGARRARARSFVRLALPALGRRPLETYQRDRWEYLLVSTNMYGRFLRDPEHHPAEVEFYRRLRATGTVLYEVGPSPDRRGPLVTVFRLPPAPPAGGVDSGAAGAG